MSVFTAPEQMCQPKSMNFVRKMYVGTRIPSVEPHGLARGFSQYGYNAPYEYELKNIDGIYHSCIFIKKREFANESYLKEKAEYEEALNEYKKHPSLYDHAPKNFTPQYEYWLSLTDLGKQFVEWVEEETRP